MKRILDVIGEYDCILCPTFEEALSFCRIAHEQGLVWGDGRSYIEYTRWEEYKDKTVYFPQRGQFGSEKTQQAYINVIFFSKFKERLKENKSMKRIWDVIKKNEWIHCKTIDEAIEYCKIADNQGLKWSNRDSYIKDNRWMCYTDKTVYNPHTGRFDAISKPRINVISFEEFKERLKLNNMNKEMKIEIPKGYEFDCIENGVIKFKEAKKEFPKTIKECDCLLTKRETYGKFMFETIDMSDKLTSLLIAREAYRNGWKPDWKDCSSKFAIYSCKDVLSKGIFRGSSCVLSFQSEEVRDAFYENFKDLLEEAKELI